MTIAVAIALSALAIGAAPGRAYGRAMLPRALIALVTVVLLAACGGSGTPAAQRPSSTAGGADAVKISDFKFAPATLDAKAGAKVTITNNDSTTHTATADGGAFDTGDLDPGASKTITLSKPGTYAYHCQIHPFMKATIAVKADLP